MDGWTFSEPLGLATENHKHKTHKGVDNGRQSNPGTLQGVDMLAQK